jgi:uncharacterized protein
MAKSIAKAPAAAAATPAFGSIAHTEIAATDPAAARRFLEKAFGWSFGSFDTPNGPYHTYETPGGSRGGIRATQPKEPTSVVSYVQVQDLAEAQRKIEGAGGRIVLPRTEVPGMGAFFWFQVPGGPVLACWQAAPAQGR